MNQFTQQRIADIQRGNVPVGYKTTKCGIIPDTWSCCQPKEIFYGKSIKNNAPELPVLSVTQGNGVMLRSEMDKDILYKEDSISSYKRVDIGDFVISLRSFEGGIEYSSCQGVVSPAYTIFSCSENVCGDYFKYYFKSDFFIKKLNTAVYGIRDGKQIGFQDFSNLFIHRPPLEEQRRIAEILGGCDRVIALKKELISEKKKQKKALMQKLLNPDSGFRLPGFSGKWKNIVLEDICSFAGGGTPDTKREDFWNGTIPWISSADVEEKNFSVNPHRFITTEAIKFSATQLCPQESLLIVSRVGVGKIAIAQEPLCTSQDFTNLTKINGNVIFYAYLLKTILEAKARQTQGTSIKGITVAEIKHFQLAVPQSLKEQQAIADILSAADKEIDLLEQELAQQEQKKKSLMQLLLTGIVRV